ncbi:MAG TPA: DegQ family serine endoprotease [Verrucomicrobiae bacterium]|jgi:serine protease Do|nr:DegQ family serine endoprotease [Verrucomicrobiae bacterium]
MKKLFYVLNNRAGGILLAAGLVMAGSAVAFDVTSKDKAEHPSINVPMDESAVSRDTLPHGSYAPVVKKVTPAVVKIVTTSRVNEMSDSPQGMPGFDDPFWRRFFGDQSHRGFSNGQSGPQIQHGLGSGVIVTKDGYIMTNNHVVDGAKEVKVTLQDGREFTAKVIGRDPKSDIAVVKIDAKDLPTVPLADSEKVEIGDVVLAIGNPFGIGQTVTSGIVSAKDRGNMGIEDYEDFIQTDAAINPGNSGGALVDISGRLIGINTAILSRSGGNQGVGFAIPSDLARTVMEGLVKNGHVTRGYLGVMIQSVTPALADEFKLKDNKGALISDVVHDGPADKAGLKNGDVVIDFNGQPVVDSRRLQLSVAGTAPGTKVPLEILRDGEKKSLEVTVKQLPGTDELANADASDNSDTGTLNGVEVADLDQRAHQQFNVPKDVKGAVVTQVAPGSAAAEAGLKSGDVIQEIDRKPVKSAEDAVKLTEKSDDKRTLVRVWQNGGSHYVVVDESKNAG